MPLDGHAAQLYTALVSARADRHEALAQLRAERKGRAEDASRAQELVKAFSAELLLVRRDLDAERLRGLALTERLALAERAAHEDQVRCREAEAGRSRDAFEHRGALEAEKSAARRAAAAAIAAAAQRSGEEQRMVAAHAELERERDAVALAAERAELARERAELARQLQRAAATVAAQKERTKRAVQESRLRGALLEADIAGMRRDLIDSGLAQIESLARSDRWSPR